MAAHDAPMSKTRRLLSAGLLAGAGVVLLAVAVAVHARHAERNWSGHWRA